MSKDEKEPQKKDGTSEAVWFLIGVVVGGFLPLVSDMSRSFGSWLASVIP